MPIGLSAPVPCLSLPVLSLPLYLPFLQVGLTADCPCFPALCGVLSEEGTVLAIGQVPPSGHPIPAVGNPSPTAALGPEDVHLRGQFSDRGIQQPSACPFLRSALLTFFQLKHLRLLF